MNRKTSRRFEISLCAAIAAIAVIVTGLVAMDEHRPLDVEEMKIDVADIQSFAAEGSLLAEQRIGATVTHDFAKVHTDMWREKIDELARKYRSREPEAPLARFFGDIGTLADDLHAAADEVSSSFAQKESANTAAAQLREVELRARTLTSRLERQA